MTTTNSYEALLAAFNALAAKVDLTNEKVDRLTALAVENASKPKAKSTKVGASSSNPVGLDPSTGEPEKKFPSNTINWIKYKVVKDNNFLKNVLGAAYAKLESKHSETLKSKNLTGDAYQRQLAQLIWTDIVNNSKNAGSEEVKKQCLILIQWFKNSWVKENDAFNAELKNSASASAAPAVVGGVSIPEATLVVPSDPLPSSNYTNGNYTNGDHANGAPASLFSNHGLPAGMAFTPVSLGLPSR